MPPRSQCLECLVYDISHRQTEMHVSLHVLAYTIISYTRYASVIKQWIGCVAGYTGVVGRGDNETAIHKYSL